MAVSGSSELNLPRDGQGPLPLPRWQQLLLPAVLGAAADPGYDGHGEPPRSARDWLVDLAIFSLAVLAAIGTGWSNHGDVDTVIFVVDVVLSIPACLALWWRRRHPAAVGWLTVVLTTVSGASVHAAQLAIFSAAIRERPRRVVQMTVAAIAATAIDCAIYTGDHGRGDFNWGFFLAWAGLTVVAFGVGSFIRVRRELVLSLHDRARRLESEQQLRISEAQLAERARIAREMHDVLAHRISLLSVHAGALEFHPDATPEEIARAASVVRISARAAQEDLREVIGVLRADPNGELLAPPQPTIVDVAALVGESRHAGMDVTLTDGCSAEPVPSLVGRTVFRVVQEALTNARKHAPGQPVAIVIAGQPGGTISVEVVNRPGVGESERWAAMRAHQVGSGTGLVGLAERLTLAGGTLEHQSLVGGGFRLAATLPWPPVVEL